ncbi:MAG: molybdenum cofactor biosynthesis protein MoaE [Phycisphaeraceae bacterium]|nr:molybdenum cofactor biosynthesis protein MoaE [Phycisphaeraceae bacterium]
MTLHPSIEITLVQGCLLPEPPHRPPEAGAVITFEGVIRPLEDHRSITAIEYEAYRPMADHQLDLLARATADRFHLTSILVRHSMGVVAVGACAFRLIIAAPHRAPALEAAAWFIDRLKQDVPIWKRPRFADHENRPQ